jgi:beta-lactamase class A
VIVTAQEDQALLNQFLEKAYLEWSDQAHHGLDGQTPRHAAASPALRSKVSALIDEMERHDPGLPRMGKTAFAYNKLRAHVGLDEVPA